MIWDQLTTEEIGALDKTIPVVLLTAATEQHGPHLPLCTDRLIGEHFCRELDHAIPQGVLILPTLSIGCSAHHLDFPGSLSLSHETFLHQIEEIVDCVNRHGFNRIILLNSHGGNQGVNSVATDKLGHAHPDCRIVSVTWWKLGADQLLTLNSSGMGGTGHACEFETSLLLHFSPDHVRADIPMDVRTNKTYSWGESDMMHGSEATLYRSIREMNASGVVGTPSAATARTGAAISRIVTQRLLQIINDLTL
jgi:creatinine amidohydrolase